MCSLIDKVLGLGSGVGMGNYFIVPLRLQLDYQYDSDYLSPLRVVVYNKGHIINIPSRGFRNERLYHWKGQFVFHVSSSIPRLQKVWGPFFFLNTEKVSTD